MSGYTVAEKIKSSAARHVPPSVRGNAGRAKFREHSTGTGGIGMDPDSVARVFKILIDRRDITLEEARNVAQTCSDALIVFEAEGDSLLRHLHLYRRVPKDFSKRRRPCSAGCGRLTTRRFDLYPHAGPLCRRCEKERHPYRTIDYTTARRRFYLSRDDLEEVPAIMRYTSHIRCRYFRPADLLAVALKRHGGHDGLRARRAIGLKRRAAALKGIERRRQRLAASIHVLDPAMMHGVRKGPSTH